jgi:hypothetical protein
VKHQDFPGESFHVAIKNIKVESKGPPDDFFDQVAPPEAEEKQRNSGPAADNTEEVPNPYIRGGVHFEDDTTAAMHAHGIEVDDDKLIVSMVNEALMGLIVGMLGIIPTQEPHLSE